MSIPIIGGTEPPSKDNRVSGNQKSGKTSRSSSADKAPVQDAHTADTETAQRVQELTSRLVESPEVRRERVESLREEYREGRLRQQEVFEATAEAILKGNSVLNDVDLDELI